MKEEPAFDLTYRRQSFPEAFAQARRMRLKTFSWNGEFYHTMTEREERILLRESRRQAEGANRGP